ncbi:hypothetical protein N7535_000649 [Penicillium sp. DV-2018c]|nr:hypothetical protein N7461_006099 [Penicillium sp. DV-2018c]KAJ5582029.1 hypothetical protein N7535_000649 [Penicillium sp. DV-2018c]
MTSTDLEKYPKAQWRQSAGKWRRSTKALVGRSTMVWYNSKHRYSKSTTDRSHRIARPEDPNEQTPDHTSSSAPRSSHSRFYSRASSNEKTESSSAKSITSQSHLSPEQQIRGFYKAIVPVMSLVAQTKQLRNEKVASLGEIEDEWISSTIADAENAADELSAVLKPFWVNQSNCNGWNRDHYNRALKKESLMLLCHSRLETVFGHLRALKVTSSSADSSSTVKLSGETQVFELSTSLAPAEQAVPKIIVTQWDGEHDACMDQRDLKTGERPRSHGIQVL